MKRLITSLALIGLVAGSAAIATYAYFTSQAQVLGNSVTAAVLKIRTGTSTLPVSLTGLAPGFESPAHDVRIVNDNAAGSNIAATLKGTSQFASDSASLYNNLILRVTDTTGSTTYFNNWLKDFSGTNLSTALLAPGAYADYKFYYKLNPAVGNSYQGLLSKFNLVFDATQQMPE